MVTHMVILMIMARPMAARVIHTTMGILMVTPTDTSTTTSHAIGTTLDAPG